MHILVALFLLLFFLLQTGIEARADPISIAILSYVGISATAGTTIVALTTFALTMGASLGLSYLSNALFPKQGAATRVVGGTSGRLQAGVVPRAFGVGRYMTAGSLVYHNSYGEGTKHPNARYAQVVALSDLPVTGLVELWVDGEKVTYDPVANPAETNGVPIPEYHQDSKHHLWIRFYNGTQTTADSLLVSKFSADADRPYTSTRIGKGIAYAVITARLNNELFSSFPECKFVLDGIKLYDRRKDSTAGGSGSHRWAFPSTWEFTRNNRVIAENILRGIYYQGQWLYGAQTVTNAQLPSASWFAAANECDVAVTLAAGGTEPQFQANGEIQFDVEPADTLEELNKCCNGKIAEVGGVYKTRVGAAGAAVFSFTDGDILSTDPQTFEPFPSLGRVINHVTAKYINPKEGWNVKDAPPLVSTALEAEDDGRRNSVDVMYGFVTSGTTVQRLMLAERFNARAWRTHALPMPPDAFVLEPLDVVSFDSERNGYVAKQFEIVSADDLPNLDMGLALKELDPNAYDWEVSDEQPIVDGTIKIIRPGPQPIIAWSASPYTIVSGLSKRAAILIGWDPDNDDVDGIKYQIRLKSTSVKVLEGEGGVDVFQAGALIVSQNLLPNTLYQARGRYRPASPRQTDWSSWLDVTTPNVKLNTKDFDDSVRIELETGINARINSVKQSLAIANKLLFDLQNKENLDVKTLQTQLVNVKNAITAAYILAIQVAVGPSSAIARRLEELEADFKGVNARIKTDWIVGAKPGFAFAAYDLLLTAEKARAGLTLVAQSIAGKAVAQVWIEADHFMVGKTGDNGTFKPPFVVSNVNGKAKVLVDGEIIALSLKAARAFIADLSAITANLGTVTAGKIILTKKSGSVVVAKLEILDDPPSITFWDNSG